MKKADTVFLQHILDAIKKIADYTQNMTADQFAQNGLVQDGVVRELEIVGEASRKLSEEFRHRWSQVPWNQIIGLRNKMIHAYFSVSLDIVWEIVRNDLPVLQQQVEKMLEESNSSTRLA